MAPKSAHASMVVAFELFLSKHETSTSLMYWVCSGGTGRPAAAYKAARTHARAAFLWKWARVLLFRIIMFENYVGATPVMESR